MKRIPVQPRANLQQRADELGFDFHHIDGQCYWDERCYYEFALEEIEQHLENPTAELAAMCQELVSRVVGDECALTRLRIPENAWDMIAQSWHRRDPTIYGRFDL